jgi:hypothetical protein
MKKKINLILLNNYNSQNGQKVYKKKDKTRLKVEIKLK